MSNLTTAHKESNLYLRFLKENVPLIILPTMLLAGGGIYYQSQQPVNYQATALLELSYSEKDIIQKSLLTDVMVANLRANSVIQELGLSEPSHLSVFKNGPVSATLILSDTNQSQVQTNINKLINYGVNKFSAHQLGTLTISPQKERNVLLMVGVTLLGLTLGIFLSLARLYLRKF